MSDIFFPKPRLVHTSKAKPGLIIKNTSDDEKETRYGYIAGLFGSDPYFGEIAIDTVYEPNLRPKFREDSQMHISSPYVDSAKSPFLAIGQITLSNYSTRSGLKHGLMKSSKLLAPRERKNLLLELIQYHLTHQEQPVFEIPKAGTYSLKELNRFLRIRR
ncbi:hypothetical protein A3K73_06675 [Candidatus Pacearchaeota archaeon RBG_13_36_9]|nr:MAG: hypothetical protein A3K73_06675 [Candidatus Pacearchaeota archaeon RBG_13_36_9]